MSLYTKSEIRLVAASDGTAYKTKLIERDDRDTHQTERTDCEAVISGRATVSDAATFTVNLNDHDVAAIRLIYIESDGQVKVSLLDNSAAVNEITSLVVGGSTATSTGRMFAEIAGFTIAASDTFEILNSSGSTRTVFFWLAGTAK